MSSTARLPQPSVPQGTSGRNLSYKAATGIARTVLDTAFPIHAQRFLLDQPGLRPALTILRQKITPLLALRPQVALSPGRPLYASSTPMQCVPSCSPERRSPTWQGVAPESLASTSRRRAQSYGRRPHVAAIATGPSSAAITPSRLPVEAMQKSAITLPYRVRRAARLRGLPRDGGMALTRPVPFFLACHARQIGA
jgi:hypothetical protein